MQPGGSDARGTPELALEYLGSPVLRRSARQVAVVDDELRELVERMFLFMYAARGQGLAAPQIGLGIRLAVVEVPPEGPRYVLVNPRIAWASRERMRGVEGCLSVPGVEGFVERAAEVVVEALDLEGNVRTIGGTGELARCLQHEIDHLDGILYVDRLSPLSRRMTLARYHKVTRAVRPGTREPGPAG